MLRKRLIIEISPHRFDAAIVRGNETIAKCSATPLYDCEEDSLDQLLDRSQAPFAAFVSEHGLKRSQTVVLYSSTSASFGVFSCPASVGPTGSLEAAQLALEEAVDFSLFQNPHCTTLLCTDNRPDPNDESTPQRSHVFGLAESDETADRICKWVRSCGMDVETLMPTRAVSMLAAVEEALAPGSNHTRIVLHMSDDSAVLAAAHKGSLRFVRTIGTGVSTLVGAMASGMNRSQVDKPADTLSHIQAADLLRNTGIPESGQELDAVTGISANDVLPFLQPILQRCAVETKQSIRFGLSSSERAHARFQMTAAGGQIPGLPELIARLAGVEIDESLAATDESASPVTAFASLTTPPLGLLSNSARQTRQHRRLQVALGIGLSAAALLLGAEAFQTHNEIQNAQIVSQTIEDRLTSTRPIQEASQRLAQSEGLLERVDRTYRQISRGQTRWDAVLALFSAAAPEQVTFSRMNMSHDEGKPVCSVNGEIRADTEQAARQIFASLIDSLSAAPIVQHCAIASTAKDRTEPGIQRFELRLALRENSRTQMALTLSDGRSNGSVGGQQ